MLGFGSPDLGAPSSRYRPDQLRRIREFLGVKVYIPPHKAKRFAVSYHRERNGHQNRLIETAVGSLKQSKELIRVVNLIGLHLYRIKVQLIVLPYLATSPSQPCG